MQNHTRTNNHGFNLIYTIETFDNNIRQHVLALSSTLTLISMVEHILAYHLTREIPAHA